MSTRVSGSPLPLTVFSLLALLALVAVEGSRKEVRQRHYADKLAAARTSRAAEQYLRNHRLEKGIFVDMVNDPNQSALIGQQVTPTTTDRGDLGAKLASTNPNFAGVVVDLLKEAGIRSGDRVAVGMTGSFPALNISALSALETVGAVPVVITSVGSSSWGANDPQFTWLDMERVLAGAGILRTRSVAASMGGGGDVGRGLSPEGRDLLLDAIRRNGIPLIREDTLARSVRSRMRFYDGDSGFSPVRAFLNIGGGIASLGAAVNAQILPTGLSGRLWPKNYAGHGVIAEMAQRGVPVIHLYNVQELCARYGLPQEPVPLPSPGQGGVFAEERYDTAVTASAAGVLLALLLAAAVLERRGHRLGSERVQSTPAEADEL
ncbi:MAG: poly-gamma-glutamate system protein [Bacteroidota bacterium]